MVEKIEKCCTGCKKELSLNLFYKNKTNEDGKITQWDLSMADLISSVKPM